MTLVRRWNDYWFAPSRLIDLAMCRVIVVAYQLYILISWDHRERLAEQARRPDELFDALPILNALTLPWGWEHRPSLGMTHVVYWMTVASGWFALVGLLTKPAMVLFAVGTAFLVAYSYSFGDFHHPEGIMMITLMALALAPTGGSMAVDDLWRRLRRNRKALRFEKYSRLEDRSPFARWPLLLVGWCFSLIYFSGFKCKLERGGLDWMNGYTLRYYMYEDGLLWGGIGLWAADFHEMTVALSWVTMVFEGFFFVAMLVPLTRWFFVPAGIGLHTGIWITMCASFGTFIACYAVFVPWGDAFRRVHTFLERRRAGHPDVLYDGTCPLCIRSVTILHYLDWFGRLEFTDLEQRPPDAQPRIPADELRREMHMVLPDGSIRCGFYAFRHACRSMPLIWPVVPLLYVPGVPRLGTWIYARIAGGRTRVDCASGACQHGRKKAGS